eukprot:COSAG02_NODE_3974_length_5968_cov_26.913466_4_plen_119_part_00
MVSIKTARRLSIIDADRSGRYSISEVGFVKAITSSYSNARRLFDCQWVLWGGSRRVFSRCVFGVWSLFCSSPLAVKLVKMLKLVLTLPLAVAMPVDHRAERQKMVRAARCSLLPWHPA